MESIHFDIGLSGTYWSQVPEYSISIDDIEYYSGSVTAFINLEFQAALVNHADHVLKIHLLNKTSQDTITEDGVIVQDMLLNIHSIKINDVNLDELLWSHSRYCLDRSQIINGESVTHLTHCVNLGWNGYFEFKFTTPVYHWLLDNL